MHALSQCPCLSLTGLQEAWFRTMAWPMPTLKFLSLRGKKPFGLPSCFHQPQASTVILAQGGRWPHSTLPSLPAGPGCKQMVGVDRTMRPAPHPPSPYPLISAGGLRGALGPESHREAEEGLGKWGVGVTVCVRGFFSLCFGLPFQEGWPPASSLCCLPSSRPGWRHSD